MFYIPNGGNNEDKSGRVLRPTRQATLLGSKRNQAKHNYQGNYSTGYLGWLLSRFRVVPTPNLIGTGETQYSGAITRDVLAQFDFNKPQPF